ncbi:DUF6542 domain-containing protein [Segniliparus rugosus]|uniref:DUF6542 domain-containing protein n=1 Tax=Segniliparus rugosus TaxID=286804 RepID=UPI00058F27F0|nr:DUF6542 domain-containing protein [Segniliparus rugosus]
MRSTERPTVPLPKRSALLGFPGVPWWGAVAVAVVCTAIGAAVDVPTPSSSMGDPFNWLYGIGCVLAALVVANTGLFTAAVQPSLVLFVSVPMAAWLFSPSEQVSGKGGVLFLAVPLISRFPWMAWVSGIVLAICVVRWGLWRLAQRRENVAAALAKTRSAKKPAERRASSAAPVRRHKSSPDLPARSAPSFPARKAGFADEPARRETVPAPRRRSEPPLERRLEPPLERRVAARANGGPARPRIDPRGLDPMLRHTPARGLPPLPSGARYRQDPAARSSSSSSSRGAKHALPPARIPAPPSDPRQTPRRRRYED